MGPTIGIGYFVSVMGRMDAALFSVCVNGSFYCVWDNVDGQNNSRRYYPCGSLFLAHELLACALSLIYVAVALGSDVRITVLLLQMKRSIRRQIERDNSTVKIVKGLGAEYYLSATTVVSSLGHPYGFQLYCCVVDNLSALNSLTSFVDMEALPSRMHALPPPPRATEAGLL